MNQKKLTKTFMMISNLKNPLAAKVFIKKFSTLRVNVGPLSATEAMCCVCYCVCNFIKID